MAIRSCLPEQFASAVQGCGDFNVARKDASGLLPSLFLLLFCCSCGSSAKLNRAKAPDEIRETVFRYQFAQFKHTGEQVYFIRISGEDPSDEFMQRFKEAKPVVKKNSQSNPG